MLNAAGKVKTQAEYAGSMIDLGVQVQQAMAPSAPNPTVQFLLLTTILQTFTRIDPPTSAADTDARFDFFIKAVLPSLPQNTSTSVLTFLPSYFDFVRRRNHLHNTPISVGAISEETPVSSVARALSHFFTGRHSVLLYSRRAHHFRRYDIRGVTRVVFYALLDNRGWVYWAEHWRGEGYGAAEGPCYILQVECYKLERVVGRKRVRVMCTDKGLSGGRMHVQINRRITRSRVSKWKRVDYIFHLVFFFSQV